MNATASTKRAHNQAKDRLLVLSSLMSNVLSEPEAPTGNARARAERASLLARFATLVEPLERCVEQYQVARALSRDCPDVVPLDDAVLGAIIEQSRALRARRAL